VGEFKERMNPLNPDDIDDLKQLIEFLKANQVAEFELDRGELRVRLKLSSRRPHRRTVGSGQLAGERPNDFGSAGNCRACRSASCRSARCDPNAGLHIVKSPIVGTYYGSPSPGASAFVSAGDHVDKGRLSASSKP